MPLPGYKTITVPDEVKQKLKQLAEKTHRTIPEVVEDLVEKADKSLKRIEKKELCTQQAN